MKWSPMKLALIAGGLFLLSYVALNRGLGPHPLLLIVPVLTVVATTMVAHRLMKRGRKQKSPSVVELDVPAPPQPRPPVANPPPRQPGGKARKLF
jgi:hypothetical protein